MAPVGRARHLFRLRLHIWRTVKDILVFGIGWFTLGLGPSYVLHPGKRLMSACMLQQSTLSVRNGMQPTIANIYQH